MSDTFPVSHSILDADALAEAVSQRYAYPPINCQLISRGSNDIYRLRTRQGIFAVRVLRKGWRDHGQLSYELEWVSFLAEAGLPVAAPARARDGSFYFSVNAPEGPRKVVVIHWLDGNILAPPLKGDTAERVGKLLAKIHLVGAQFKPTCWREVDTMEKIVRHRATLADLLAHLPEEQAYFDNAMDWLLSQVNHLESPPPKLHTHGDLHFGNIMQTPQGELAIIDFDDGGYDFAVKDLMAFLWRNTIEAIPESVSQRFLSGYEAVRPLNASEQENFALFLAARHVYLLSSYSAHINKMGPVPGFDADLQRYLGLARDVLDAAGFHKG